MNEDQKGQHLKKHVLDDVRMENTRALIWDTIVSSQLILSIGYRATDTWGATDTLAILVRIPNWCEGLELLALAAAMIRKAREDVGPDAK